MDAGLHRALRVGDVTAEIAVADVDNAAIMAGLLPIMWSTGTGSEVMQRIAVPMIGGMISSTVLTLIVIPAVYGLIKGWRLPRRSGGTAGAESPGRAVAEAEIVR